MTSKIRAALTLSTGEWGIFIKAWFLLIYFDILLRNQSYRRIKKYLDDKAQGVSGANSGKAWEVIRRNQRCVILAARNHIYIMGCLRQALALKWLLGRQGVPTEVRFGVRKEADQLLAHAWLEYEGQSIEVLYQGKEHFEPLFASEGRQ